MATLSPRFRRALAAALVPAFLLAVTPPALAAPGDLDPTFDGDGRAVIDVGPRSGAVAVLVQPDGKIVTGGTELSGFLSRLLVTRLNPDGSLDTSFAGDGTANIEVGVASFAAAVARQQADGKILIGGTAVTGGSFVFAVVRLNADGTPDAGFGTAGVVTTSFPGADSGSSFQMNDLILQPDGKIVAGGTAPDVDPLSNHFALVRYNSNGSLDTTGFGVGGRVLTDFPTGVPDQLQALALQPDGKIVAAGSTEPLATIVALARYNTNGTLDASFGSGGLVTTPPPAGGENAYDVVVQPDGRIVVAGESGSGDFVLLRYLSNGSLDASFGVAGRVTTDFGTTSDSARALVRQPDGKLIAGGTAGTQPGSVFALARYQANGALDPTFSGDGRVTTDFANGDPTALSFLEDLALQPDGKLVAAGARTNEIPGGDPLFGFDFNQALARYETGLVPSTPGAGGCSNSGNTGLNVFVCGLSAPLSVLNLGRNNQTAVTPPASAPGTPGIPATGSDNTGIVAQLVRVALPINLINLGDNSQFAATP
ncbi:MAG: delta-60 repeat domain-containing protein [Acidimicrobiia bacterium]